MLTHWPLSSSCLCLATKHVIWCRGLEANLSTRCGTAGIFVKYYLLVVQECFNDSGLCFTAPWRSTSEVRFKHTRVSTVAYERIELHARGWMRRVFWSVAYPQLWWRGNRQQAESVMLTVCFVEVMRVLAFKLSYTTKKPSTVKRVIVLKKIYLHLNPTSKI